MKPSRPPKAILDKAKLVTGKRSRVVVDHILKHGSITTEDLENYGYKHPPRAIRDVREQGLPLEMFWTQNSAGRKIAGYRFGDPSQIRHDRLGGRTVFSKEFHAQLWEAHRHRCAICQTTMDARYLQVDHRIPYEVVGDASARDLVEYMPLCGTCNRAKSWSCEHCRNWRENKDPAVCAACYWASPEDYQHVAMRDVRRLDVVWEEAEVTDYDQVAKAAQDQNETIPDFVKKSLRRMLGDRS